MKRPTCILAIASGLSTMSIVPHAAHASDSFVRSIARDGFAGFETASTVYRPSAAEGTEVALVGVVHIGDRAYYRELVDVLGRSEVVLYESVLPRGAFGTGGDSELARQRSTQDAMLFVRGLLVQFTRAQARVPIEIAELRAFVVGRDSRLARPLDLALVDAWKGAVRYESQGTLGFRLVSLGADRAAGGRGFDLDLVLTELPAGVAAAASGASPEDPRQEDDRRDLYGELAAALGTDLQVRSIDYDRPGWVPADLPMEELLDRLWRRGERSATLEMLAEPSGFQQGVLRFLLSMVSKSTGFKKLVIQALGEAGERGSGRGAGRSALGSVDQRLILDERNDAVIDQLRTLLASDTPPRSVAIFYGAAHMADIADTLEREFALARGETTWSRAMSVDEWSAERISARIAALEQQRDAMLAADPQGAYPACERLERRIEELRERLHAKKSAAKA